MRWQLLVVALLLVCSTVPLVSAQNPIMPLNASYKLIMPMNGTSGSTLFPDISNVTPHIMYPISGAVVNTTSVAFGTGSAFGTSAGGSYITSGDSTDWDPVTGTTYAFWTLGPNTNSYLGQYQDANNQWYIVSNGGVVSYVCVKAGVVTYRIDSTANLVSNSWQQVVVQINGASSKIYINGTDRTAGGTISTSLPTFAGNLTLMWVGSGAKGQGNLDSLLISKDTLISIGQVWPQQFEFGIVNPPPIVTFSTNVTTGTNYQPVQFTDTVAEGGTTAWLYEARNTTPGNNTYISIATTQNPVVSFLPGNWTFRLTATNSNGTAMSTQTTWLNVTNTGAPVASFLTSPSSGSAALLVNFTFVGAEGLPDGRTYNWSFGDGSYDDTDGDVSHVYTFNGVFMPTLWVNNSYGTSFFEGSAVIVATNQNTQNTWYTQRLVKIKIVDAYGGPIPNANLTLNYIASTLPSTSTSWLIDAFGITPDVATQMTNNGLAMQSNTSNDGSLTFMLFPALTYGMTITNASIGLNNYQTITPSDTDYTVFCPLPYQNVNSQVYGKQTQLAQNLLYVSQINSTAVMINFQYQDTASATTAVTWNVTNWNTGAVVYGKTFGNPGTGMLIDNYTVLTVPSGVDYRFAYEATRST